MGWVFPAAKAQLTLCCRGPLLAATAWLLGLPLVFGTELLPAAETARLLESLAPVGGILLFVGLFSPESERGLLDCVAVRRAPYLLVCALRAGWLALAALAQAVLAAAFLAARGCAVLPGYAFAALAGTLFLGGLALLGAVLLGGTVAGAIPPLCWFLMDSLSNLCGRFSMLRYTTGTGAPKGALLAMGLALFALAFAARWRQLRR